MPTSEKGQTAATKSPLIFLNTAITHLSQAIVSTDFTALLSVLAWIRFGGKCDTLFR